MLNADVTSCIANQRLTHQTIATFSMRDKLINENANRLWDHRKLNFVPCYIRSSHMEKTKKTQ